MKKFLFLILLLLSSCQQYQASALVVNTQRPENIVQPTRTLQPTVTIDYQKTAQVAQSTADEARRINAQATAQHELILNQQLQMTQQVEQNNFTKASWTQQAAQTVIPLTATQQAVNNTQIPMQQRLQSGVLTATKEAPTQFVAMVRAANEKEYGARIYKGELGLMLFAIGFIATVIAVLLIGRTQEERRLQLEEKRIAMLQPVTTEYQAPEGMYKQDTGGGCYTIRQKNEVPCNEEQLSELAELVANGERTFAFNRLEYTSRTLRSHGVLRRMRTFYVDNNLADSSGDEIELNDKGVQFHEYWFDNHVLPAAYKFAQ